MTDLILPKRNIQILTITRLQTYAGLTADCNVKIGDEYHVDMDSVKYCKVEVDDFRTVQELMVKCINPRTGKSGYIYAELFFRDGKDSMLGDRKKK